MDHVSVGPPARRYLRAFTLIELVAVIAIIAVLSAIGAPAAGNVVRRSQERALESSAHAVAREGFARATFDSSYITGPHLAGAWAAVPTAPYAYDDGDGVLKAGEWLVDDPLAPAWMIATNAPLVAHGKVVIVIFGAGTRIISVKTIDADTNMDGIIAIGEGDAAGDGAAGGAGGGGGGGATPPRPPWTGPVPGAGAISYPAVVASNGDLYTPACGSGADMNRLLGLNPGTSAQAFGPVSKAKWGVAYGNGFWVAVGCGEAIHSGDGGATWKFTPISFAGAKGTLSGDLAYGNGMFIAGANTGLYYSRDNGNTWALTSNSADMSANWTGIDYDTVTGLWWAMAGGRVHKSADGVTWTFVRQLEAPGADIEAHNGTIVASSGFIWSGYVRSVNEGATWFVRNAGSPGIGNFGIQSLATDEAGGWLIAGDTRVADSMTTGHSTNNAVSYTGHDSNPGGGGQYGEPNGTLWSPELGKWFLSRDSRGMFSYVPGGTWVQVSTAATGDLAVAR